MPASPGMRFSPGRERIGDNHKRVRSFEKGIVFKERDDDNLALFNEMHSKETDNFLLQSNDDFDDNFVTMRNISDHKLGINIGARGESSNLLNAEEEKNDYEWLITPPDTPLFPSLDDEAPQAIHEQRGRPRTQPVSFSRSSTMEKSHRSSRGSASPNRLSQSPRSREPTFQPRNRAEDRSSSRGSPSPNRLSQSPRSREPTFQPRNRAEDRSSSRGSPSPNRLSQSPRSREPTFQPRNRAEDRSSSRGSPSPNRLSPSPRSHQPAFQPRNQTSLVPSSSPPPSRRPTTGSKRPSSPSSTKPSTPPPSRRLSTGSVTTSASPKITAWQANIPGFSSEAPPNLRTSLADRPASYIRGSSPASRNKRQSMSPVASRSIASSADDDVESLRSVIIEGSERSNLRKVGGFRNNKAPVFQKPVRTVSSSSTPKRSFDMALRQMDNKKGPQNMFRPLLSSVPSTNFYAGKVGPTPAWNSSVTTSSNASSDFDTSGPLYIEENEHHEDDATSGYVKALDHNSDDDEVFMFEEPESVNEDMANETQDISPNVDGFENLVQCDTVVCVVSDDFIGKVDLSEVDSVKDMLICSRCGCVSSDITNTEDNVKLCPDCQKLTLSLSVSDSTTSLVVVTSSLEESTVSDEYHDLVNTMKPQMTLVNGESPEQSQHTIDFPDCLSPPLLECEPMEVNDQVISQPSLSYNDEGSEQIQHTVDFGKSTKLESTEGSEQVISQPSLSYSDEGSEPSQHTVDFPKSTDDFPKSTDDFPKSTVISGEGISVVPKRSTSIFKGHFIHSGNFSASSLSYDDLSYVRDSTNSIRSSIGRGSMSASSSVDFGPNFHRQLSSRKSDIENYKYDPMNVKYRRSVSSLSLTSSHAFRPSSVGTSTLDSFEVSIVPDVADSASVGPQETSNEHNIFIENEGGVDIETTLLLESSNIENPTSFSKVDDLGNDISALTTCTFEKVENLGKDTSTLMTSTFEKVDDLGALTTCTFEESTSLDHSVENTDLAEVQLDAILEGEHDQTCSASQCNLSESSERSVEEIQDYHVSTALCKDIVASVMECDASNHSTSIMEESTVLVEGQGGTKGRSLTLEEATDTILFCSSIVHNLAYEAATLAIEKTTPPDFPDNDNSFPLTPAVPKDFSSQKDQKTSKGSSKSEKTRQKKNSTKDANRTNICEETELPKARIVYPYNKENKKPPKIESKCNCTIM